LRHKTIHDLSAFSEAVKFGYIKTIGSGDDLFIEVTKKGMQLINYEY
jgi:hypothetical protein